MTLFGLVVAMATSASDTLIFWTGVFSALFYLYLIYSLYVINGSVEEVVPKLIKYYKKNSK